MLAIIPARGGSKGVPGKNIKLLNGKPLIAYTIEAALASDSIERVIVTTDSCEIAEVAKKYGAEVPFIRPASLAEDGTKAQDVYIHAIEYMRNEMDVCIEKFMVLLPTAPFRNAKHIDEAVNLFERSKAITLISIRKADIPASWLLNKDDNNMIVNCGFDAETSSGNRQGNTEHFLPNGAIYILDYKLLKTKSTYYSNKTIGYLMDYLTSIDIDTYEDFEYAEYLMHKREIGEV